MGEHFALAAVSSAAKRARKAAQPGLVGALASIAGERAFHGLEQSAFGARFVRKSSAPRRIACTVVRNIPMPLRKTTGNRWPAFTRASCNVQSAQAPGHLQIHQDAPRHVRVPVGPETQPPKRKSSRRSRRGPQQSSGDCRQEGGVVVHHPDEGKWRGASGGWQGASGGWRVAGGEWRVDGGRQFHRTVNRLIVARRMRLTSSQGNSMLNEFRWGSNAAIFGICLASLLMPFDTPRIVKISAAHEMSVEWQVAVASGGWQVAGGKWQVRRSAGRQAEWTAE